MRNMHLKQTIYWLIYVLNHMLGSKRGMGLNLAMYIPPAVRTSGSLKSAADWSSWGRPSYLSLKSSFNLSSCFLYLSFLRIIPFGLSILS
jgi:hypothetical protein